MSFKQIPLNEFITLQRGFDLPKGDRLEGTIPVVASTGIGGYHNTDKVEAPGVVIGRSGSIGGGQYIQEPFWPLNTTLWVKDFKGHDPRYVYYLMRSIDFSIFNVGSGVPTLNRNHLSSLLVNELGINYERAIAKLLGDLDDKININYQINLTLEKMAQTLFKSWFVDFDPVIDNALDASFFEQDLAFSEELLHRVELRKAVRESDDFKPLPEDIRRLFPDVFEECAEPALGLGGWIPAGWGISKLSAFGNIICGKTPSKKEKSFYGNDIPFIKIPDMHGNVFITKTSDNLSFEGGKSQIKKLIPEGSLCVSSIATVGLVSITTESAYTNQQINSIVPQHKYFRDYLYFSLLNKNKHFHDLASGGSTTLNMNTTLFSNVLFIQPDKFILEFFQQESGRLLERIKCSKYEIGELTQLRDTLLPKLISGELSLNDINTDIPEEASN